MRKPMVTRTIISTSVTALCVNPQSAETFEQEFILTGRIADKDKALKRVSKLYSTDDCAIVAIRNSKRSMNFMAWMKQTLSQVQRYLTLLHVKRLKQSSQTQNKKKRR